MFSLFVYLIFFNQVIGRNWCRTKLVVKLSSLRLKVKFYAEKARCAQGFTIGIHLLNMPAYGTFPLINTEHSLKAFLYRCYLLFSFFDSNTGKHLIVIAPFKGILPKSKHFR